MIKPYRFLQLFLSVSPLVAQNDRPLTVLEALEKLQNDLSGALAHSDPSYGERVRINEINAVLAENIGSQRSLHRVDEKQLKAAMKDIGKLTKASGFLDQDSVTLNSDSDDLKYVIAHGTPIFRGYRNVPRQ